MQDAQSFHWPKEVPNSEQSRKALRQIILESIQAANSGHPGGSLSLVEILSSIFDKHFVHDSKEPMKADRDRLVLSKGHGVPALYALLSQQHYFDAKEMLKLRSLGHFLQGHPDRNHYELMEASTGSLGQGGSVALGLAMGLRLDFESGKLKRLPTVYCVMGDGEMQEGQVWEMLMAAPKFQTGNLVAILDYNKGQIDGTTKEVMDLEPLADKLKAFNWNVLDIDGHDVNALTKALDSIKIQPKSKPTFIIAHTVKGKGVSFMEHPTQWHGASPTREQLVQALDEIWGGKGVRPQGTISGA